MGTANELDLGGMTVLAKAFKSGANTPASGATVRQVTSSGSSLTVTRNDHLGKDILLSAASATVILPAASGSGDEYHFVVTTTASGGNHVIKVANASDTMVGYLAMATGAAASGVVGDVAGSTDDTITMNGTTSGGIAGTDIYCKDLVTNVWYVTGVVAASGTATTIFSATVS